MTVQGPFEKNANNSYDLFKGIILKMASEKIANEISRGERSDDHWALIFQAFEEDYVIADC